ncbi:MAG: GntR family transcriptional regulator, partial [Roseococcus sp.]
RQGIGTYVTEATSERALFHFFRAEALDGGRITPTSRLHRLELRPARPEEARALALPKGARVHRMFRQRFVAGHAAIVEEIALPEALFPGFRLPIGVELSDELYVHYQRHHGLTVMRVTEKLSALACPAAIAELLGRAAGEPVLHIARIAFDVMDRPVELRLSWMETGALRYAIELR